jgi:hypothetical protein
MKTLSSSEIESYMAAAQSAMFQYQLIEQMLKLYISRAHSIIRARLPDGLLFDYKDTEFDSMPLERLLNVFGKLTANKALLKKLNATRDARNHVAHKAFALFYLSSIQGATSFRAELKKVIEAKDASISAFIALNEELDLLNELTAKHDEGGNCMDS